MRKLVASFLFLCSGLACAQQLANDQFQLQYSGTGLSSLKHTKDVYDTDYILGGRSLGDVVVRYRSGTGAWQQVDSATGASQNASGVHYDVGRAVPTIATTSKGNSSIGPWGTNALNDQIEPKSSRDQNIPFFAWGDHHGTEEWVEYNFGAAKQVSSVEVYWAIGNYEDYKWDPPVSWKIQYKDGDQWKDVHTSDSYGMVADRFNHVSFEPVTTERLRLVAKLPKDATSAIYEWRVNTDKGKEVAPVPDIATTGRFELEGDSLVWKVDVTNQTLQPLEIGDLGLALP
ncbi:MAG TPA: discoidin domain-containing protein, partial [Terriglobales bacterium]|nr:discoidin domain-containing protein [Terriglobales bacterium]